MSDDGLYYDPYDVEIDVDPYPTYRRLRDEAPLYYNERYDFWALSRFSDVEAALKDSTAPQLGQGRHPRGRQGRPRHAARRVHQRGPAAPHHPPRPGVAGLHPEEDEGARSEGSGLLRRVPGPAGGLRPVRLRARPRRGTADEDDRHVGRHPRRRPAGGARAGPTHPTEQARRAAAGPEGPLLRRQPVRRVRGVAGEEPLGRPRHRAARTPSSRTSPARSAG